jgi:hypothetical protein
MIERLIPEFVNHSPRAVSSRCELAIGHEPKRDFTLLVGGEVAPPPFRSSIARELGPIPAFRPTKAFVGIDHGAGQSGTGGYSEAAGTLVELGSLALDALKVPAKLGLPAEPGSVLTMIMAGAETTGWTGQVEIATLDAAKASVDSTLPLAESDLLEIDKTELAASPDDPLVLKRRFEANRLRVLITNLKKADKVLGAEKTVAVRGITYIGGHAGKGAKK